MEPAELEAQVKNLQVAVETNRVIGMACGILIERMRLTPDAAFAVLRACSQGTHRKLHDLAMELVETGSIPGLSRAAGIASPDGGPAQG